MKSAVRFAFLLVPFLVAQEPAKPVEFSSVLEFRFVSLAADPAQLRVPVVGGQETVVLEPQVQLDVRAVAQAEVQEDQLGRPIISLTFTPAGAKTFAEVTRVGLRRRLAMIVNGEVFSAPTIQGVIEGGKAVITGSFTKQEAEILAARINDAVKANQR